MMTNRRKISLLAITGICLLIPLISQATASGGPVFDDPLGGQSLVCIIQRIILWLLGLAGFIALLALVIGGIRLILGGLGSEGEVSEAKRIIYWAIIGLVVVGMAATILSVAGFILGLSASPLSTSCGSSSSSGFGPSSRPQFIQPSRSGPLN